MIVLSDFGKKLFQYEHLTGVGNTLSVTVVGGLYTADGLLDNAVPPVVVAGGNLRKTSITAQNSILKFADHRLYITVETHLPIKTQMKILNGKEKTENSIVRIPFLNEALTTIYSRNGEIVEDISLTTKSYSGRVSFINKSNPVRQWNQLVTAYEQKIFRFQLYCVYNVFANGSFSQVKKNVPFDSDGSWDLTIRFVNKI